VLNGVAERSCEAKLEQEISANPVFASVVDAIRDAAEPFALDPHAGGLEFAPLHLATSLPSRCRMKLFRPREEKDRLCAFFFKKSNIAGSRDRFSYGAVEFLPDRLRPEEIRIWIAWLSSGLNPALRPGNLKRAFLYTIPE
jgi:hypothetical protein